MDLTFEDERLLDVVQSDADVDELVDSRLPHARILESIQKLLAQGLIAESGDRLALTDAGREHIATRQPRRKWQSGPIESLERARVEPRDPLVAWIPDADIE
jgi:hypothetical protein